MKLPHAAVALVAILITSRGFALTGERYLPESKITLRQARQVALKTYPGTIVSEELEPESGGYSFVIRHNNVKHEVGIDAKAGKVLENSIER
jgi:uncharacterized membrane protein YkoI